MKPEDIKTREGRAFWLMIKKLDSRQAIIIAIISSITTLTIASADKIFTYLAPAEKKEELKRKAIEAEAAKQVIVMRKADSIRRKKRDSLNSIVMTKTYKNMSKIYHYMDQLQKELPNSARIALYYTHDSGGVPTPGSALKCTILFTANNIPNVCGGIEYWQDEPLPEGYFKWNYMIYEASNKEFYVDDISKFPSIMKDERTREDINCNGTKAMFGTVVKKVPSSAVYYLVVSYQYTNPLQDDPYFRSTMRKYTKIFNKLIFNKDELNF